MVRVNLNHGFLFSIRDLKRAYLKQILSWWKQRLNSRLIETISENKSRNTESSSLCIDKGSLYSWPDHGNMIGLYNTAYPSQQI